MHEKLLGIFGKIYTNYPRRRLRPKVRVVLV